MTLREILQTMVADGNSTKLSSGNEAVEAGTLLQTLSNPMLERPAYLQSGLYIAEIDDRGYLGQVLFKFAKSE